MRTHLGISHARTNRTVLTRSGAVVSGETFEAAGVWLSAHRLINPTDTEAEIELTGQTSPWDTPRWTDRVHGSAAAVQSTKVPVPANGFVEIGVMVVPDPGSSIEIDYSRRVALPEPRDGIAPTAMASQYAEVRNVGADTEISLIYTYQAGTLNPGAGTTLGAELARLPVPSRDNIKLSGVVQAAIAAQDAQLRVPTDGSPSYIEGGLTAADRKLIADVMKTPHGSSHSVPSFDDGLSALRVGWSPDPRDHIVTSRDSGGSSSFTVTIGRNNFRRSGSRNLLLRR